jgi:competence protein ComEA
MSRKKNNTQGNDTMKIHTRILLITSILMMAFTFSPLTIAAKNEPTKVEHARAKVNINNANADLIADALVGVGLKKAKAIVAWRKKNGKYKQIDDLMQVKGIGEATLDKNRARITL